MTHLPFWKQSCFTLRSRESREIREKLANYLGKRFCDIWWIAYKTEENVKLVVYEIEFGRQKQMGILPP